MVIRAARPGPVEVPPIAWVHRTATGATVGSIIAAIIKIHSPSKDSSARPMVPGPLPMLRACATVTAQPAAASAARAAHGGGHGHGRERALRRAHAPLAPFSPG